MKAGSAGCAGALVIAIGSSALLLGGARAGVRGSEPAAAEVAALSRIVAADGRATVPCAEFVATRPLVVLALGQSNAGNHGTPPLRTPVQVIAGDRCLLTGDPLPGSTGAGGSIWSRLPAALRRVGAQAPVVMAPMGIDATSIGQWTSPASPLRALLLARVRAMARVGLAPDLVLWQQGEADARAATSAQRYRAALNDLGAMLREAGSTAPVLLARSTVCRSAPNAAIRDAAMDAVRADRRFWLGPDTDALTGTAARQDGCHLSGAGLDEAAALWAQAILAAGAVPLGPASSGAAPAMKSAR